MASPFLSRTTPIVQVIRRRWKISLALLILIAGVFLYPPLGGWLGHRMLCRKVEEKTGLACAAASARATLHGLVLRRVKVALPADRGGPSMAIASIDRINIPYAAAWGGGEIKIEGPHVDIAGGLAQAAQLRARLSSGRKARDDGGPGPADSRRLPQLRVVGGTVSLGQAHGGRHFFVRDVSGTLVPGRALILDLVDCGGEMPGRAVAETPALGVKRVRVRVPLVGLRPQGVPEIEFDNGHAQVLPGLGLTGMAGRIGPQGGGNQDAADSGRIEIQISGSYGGSRETLWHATGHVRPGKWLFDSDGELSIRAERFSLGKIQDVLPPSVLRPERTSIDANVDVRIQDARVSVSGKLDIVDLSLFHPAVAADPVEDLRLAVQIDATLDPVARALQIASVDWQMRDLVGRISGSIALEEGEYLFDDGTRLPWLPRIDLSLDVPRIACNRLLTSFPAALIPHLQDFELRGSFEAHLKTRIDYADLDNLFLDGDVGIDGCRVMQMSESVAVLTSPDAIINQEVEVPPDWDSKTQETEFLSFIVGPDNPDFIPYEEISAHMINAVLTTEDSRFFRHRGFATTEFKTALKRNLARGGFRLGASSITMQLVKNLLLSHEKTLSRKLQELFLVWYVEQHLTKERILELYLNAIEFGPRLYGVGPAARHYFGKLAHELTPGEAAFLSTLLPSPKRRYVHYCQGVVSDVWQRQIKRVLTRMHERERLTAEEFALAMDDMPAFDLTARSMNERQCLEWVKRITQRLPPDPPESARP